MSFTISYNKKTPFQPIKTRSSKSQKIFYFPKGVNPWFWSKNGRFAIVFFKAIQASKMSFNIFQNEKTRFYAIKTRSSKSRKIDIFPNELTHGFGPKMVIFPTFFLGNICQESVFYDILERKNAILANKNKRFKKCKKTFIFRKGITLGFGKKMVVLSNFFFKEI